MTALLKRTNSVFFLALGLLIFVSQASYAQDATLTNITVSNTKDDLLLFLNLEGAFREEMKKAILSGVPSTFSFFAQLNRVRGLWFDQAIADLEVTHTIIYDNLKKEFTVARSWKDNNSEVTKSLDEAKKWMTEINSLKIVPLDRLEKGEQYQIRVKAEVSKKTLPLYLHYILFFVSLWDFETDWYTIDFTF
ncbi:MAG: DUF4390 domain-containing protein [Desulfobacterales bacterium]|jgi:hypothetical protein